MKTARKCTVDYRERAARVRRGARNAPSRDVCDVLLRLAAKYDELAAENPRPPMPDDDAMILFRRVRCGVRSGAVVLYYLN